MMRCCCGLMVVLLASPGLLAADRADELRQLDTRVFPQAKEQDLLLNRMWEYDVQCRLRLASQRETAAWEQLRSRDRWDQYRGERLDKLRTSLFLRGLPERVKPARVTRALEGDGYRIENLLFESRAGLWVTANLYAPAKPRAACPGILICHSHHSGKTQGELQDMGMTWARQGCCVLIMDQLGHGERRQHPFVNEQAFPEPFRVGRQDYWFRCNVGMQLHLVGESLIGWMVWDLMCGVDVLLARPEIDKDKIILLGAVAGGGDPAAVAGALDERIAAVVPFNFGGPQPETKYPLPANAAKTFNYTGGGSWESTRNLRNSARDGFLPWVIVGSIAPRRLVYGHEFAWDRERDPVWARLERIYGFHETPERLAFATGRGRLSGKPPESTHCDNIGPEHRVGIHDAFARWFNIPKPDKEFQQRRPSAELRCWTPELVEELKPKLVHELALTKAMDPTVKLTIPPRYTGEAARERQRLLKELPLLLGLPEKLKPGAPERFHDCQCAITTAGEGWKASFLSLHPRSDLDVPVLLLKPDKPRNPHCPVVICLAQEGKARFVKERAGLIAKLLERDIAVCLPDLRGTGETAPDDKGRGRTRSATALSASNLMLGTPILGERVWDVRCLLAYLRSRPDIDPTRVTLWGDSFATPNPPTARLEVPLELKQPELAEPLGPLVALLTALFDTQRPAVYVHNGLASFESCLHSSFPQVPHDVIVPGLLTVADIDRLTAALYPSEVRIEAPVDGLNRRLNKDETAKSFHLSRGALGGYVTIHAERTPDEELAKWVRGPAPGPDGPVIRVPR